jgi:sec-independent protein translocase protein TatA
MLENIGIGELLLIALFILIFFGPRRIPEIARSFGRAIREFKRAVNDVRSEVESAVKIDDIAGDDGGSNANVEPPTVGTATLDVDTDVPESTILPDEGIVRRRSEKKVARGGARRRSSSRGGKTRRKKTKTKSRR